MPVSCPTGLPVLGWAHLSLEIWKTFFYAFVEYVSYAFGLYLFLFNACDS
jgi:hypothetical protein